jgi:uncharacterized heparinase superfamily protein
VAGAKRHGPPLNLLPEILRAVRKQMFAPLRAFWRRSWFYRRLLKGKLPDRIVFYPHDALPRKLEDADALLRGRFRFAGESVDVKDGSIFDKTPPSRAWAEALHNFAWLPPLSAAGGDAARTLATNLIAQWIKRQPRYSEPAWLPGVTARRLVHLFAHGRFVLANSDMMWRSKVFVSLREQSKFLARVADEAPDGLARLEAAAAHALSGACLDDQPKRLATGLARLEAEIARQILPDGGHASRSPETLVHAYRLLVMVMDALTATDQKVPPALRSAHDRMAPMLRFFRHGDGALALFNGGSESHSRMIAGLLARDEVRGQPFLHAPHSGFQRMTAARSYLVMDCGTPPKGAFSNAAHAGCLGFEFSSGQNRLIVNCGTMRHDKWDTALRATAAHSTITLADTSMATVLAAGFARDMIGARLLGGPTKVDTQRRETANGWCVEASHDGYLREFAILHERRLTLAPNGATLTGADTLVPKGKPRGQVPYAARFHIHPDVRVSPSQGGGVLLKLPGGEGWRFRSGGGTLAIEESIYLGGETARPCEQLVISGAVGSEPVEIGWVFEQIGAA